MTKMTVVELTNYRKDELNAILARELALYEEIYQKLEPLYEERAKILEDQGRVIYEHIGVKMMASISRSSLHEVSERIHFAIMRKLDYPNKAE